MAPAKSVALVCLAILAVSSAALGASAAEDAPSTRPAAAAAEKLGVLSKPLGSGLNTPLSLGRKPKYGRRFLSLMQQLVGAARNGDLNLAKQIQQQLFYVTKLRGHRRHLLQVGCCPKSPGVQQGSAGSWRCSAAACTPAQHLQEQSAFLPRARQRQSVAPMLTVCTRLLCVPPRVPPQSMCPALTSNPVTAPDAAAVKSDTTAPTTAKSVNTTGPLPAIRLATMEPCAEYLCQKDFALVKQADGTVTCQVRAHRHTRLQDSWTAGQAAFTGL